MENIIIENEPSLWANILLMYILAKDGVYKIPHMNGTNYNYTILNKIYKKKKEKRNE